MARGVPRYNSGTLSGTSNYQDLMDLVITELTAYQSDGVDAWEVAETLGSVGGAFDKVVHSVGDRTLGSGDNIGDTDLWFRLKASTAAGNDLFIRVAQDWSDTSSTGYRENVDTSPCLNNISDTVDIDWWCWGNEYEFIFMIEVPAFTFQVFHLGMPIRPFNSGLGGVARITSQSGTGNGVTIGVDRDLTDQLVEGQSVWLLNQTPDGTSLQSVGIDIVDIQTGGGKITASQIVVDGVTNTYAVGSLIGVDPAPAFVQRNSTDNYFMAQESDGTFNVGATRASIINMIIAQGTAGHMDPGASNLFLAAPMGLKMSVYLLETRGLSQLVRIVPNSATIIADGDTIQIGGADGSLWRAFRTASASKVANYATGYGPVTSETGTTHLAYDTLETTFACEAAITIASITHQSDTVLRVTFSEPVAYNAALIHPESYVFDPPLTVSAVTPENEVNPSYVDVTVSEQIDSASYDLDIQIIEAAP